MATHIKASLIFDTGREVEQSDMETLTDSIIDLLEAQFPGYSGSCFSMFPVDENGDPVK